MTEDNNQLAPASDPPPSPPPRGPRIGVLLGLAAVGLLALAIGVIWHEPIRAAWDWAGAKIAKPAAEEAEPAAEAGKPTQYWTCGMHPWVILPHPGDCPICHMKLVPVDAAKFRGQVTVDPVMTQNIGVRVAPVVSGAVSRVVRTVGTVDYDETLLGDVNLKISGWVEKLYVNTLGQRVQEGQPLLEIYSPDLYTAQEEYLLAFKRREATKAAPASSDAAAMDTDLLAAARKRLDYYDISPEQVQALERSGKAAKTMTLRSPFRGTVVAKSVVEGQKVDAGMALLRIADLSRVWVMVTVYENQLPYVEVGQKAVMRLPYVPGQTFEGKITYIYPYMNQDLRQAKVRMEFDNAAQALKPGMFANVEVTSTLAKHEILVPREAVIDTGTRQIAFVSLGQGRFEPRNVTMGVEAEGGMVAVLDGLKPGEMVVTSGEFLLDSEARLKESLAKLVEGTPAAGQPSAAATAGATELAAMPEAAAKALGGVLDGYFALGAKLADDSAQGLDAPARSVAENMDALLKIEMPDAPHFWHEHGEAAAVRGKALELVKATDLAAARELFADLSIALGKLLRAAGVPPAYGKRVVELHCPMYREGQGGNIWLQPEGEVRNPFYGKAMLGCFDRKVSVPLTGVKAGTGH